MIVVLKQTFAYADTQTNDEKNRTHMNNNRLILNLNKFDVFDVGLSSARTQSGLIFLFGYDHFVCTRFSSVQSCPGTLHHEGTIPTGTLRYKVS